jgi:hypothetical protein
MKIIPAKKNYAIANSPYQEQQQHQSLFPKQVGVG